MKQRTESANQRTRQQYPLKENMKKKRELRETRKV